MSTDNQNDKQPNTMGDWVEFGLEGAAHGLFVELPTTFAKAVDWGAAKINQTPALWGGEAIASHTLTYAPSVHDWAQNVYDTVNGWTGYTPPVPDTNGEKIVYGLGELGGQFIIPGSLLTKTGSVGLIGQASNLSLGGLAGSFGKAAWKLKWPLVAAGIDAKYFDSTGAKILGKIGAPILADIVYDNQHENHKASIYGPLTQPRGKTGDRYASVLDGIEDMAGWNIPDEWEKGLHDGFGWLGEGSPWAMAALGLTALTGSQAVLRPLFGDGLMSGLLSIGLAIGAAVYGPQLMKSLGTSGEPLDAEKKPPAPLAGSALAPAI